MDPGTVVDGKYRILRELGKGGMGAVYEAEHDGTGRRVAIKVILSEALSKEKGIVTRFQREARASGSLDSQHVVQVLDTGVDPASQSPYMVMELLSGEDVHELCGRLGALPPDLVLRIVAQACLGLQRAHERGIVHRDIKSANVFLARRDGGERVLKLLDFGIAKVRAEQLSQSDNHGLTRTGAMMGSPLYMSPEQARGAKTLDGRSDLFSLGVLMYEALTGTTPNNRCESLGELIIAVCSQPSEPVQNRAPWVPPEIAQIVHKVLELNPANRFESAAALYEAITALLPQGVAIHEGMLVGISPEMRAQVAARFEPVIQPPPSSSAFMLAQTMADPRSSGSIGSRTGAAISRRSLGEAKKPSALRWIAPVAAMVVLGGGAAAAYAVGPWRKTPAVAAVERTGEAPASAAVAAPVVPVVKAGQVTIAAPADAKVEVDGKAVEVKGGKVEVSGTVGSVHPVHVAAGGKETTQIVVLTEAGPIPAKVELVVPAIATGGPAARAGGGAAQKAGAAPSAAAVVPAAQQTTKPPPQAAGAPTIDRTF